MKLSKMRGKLEYNFVLAPVCMGRLWQNTEEMNNSYYLFREQ